MLNIIEAIINFEAYRSLKSDVCLLECCPD
jgi:hypothetical protein